MAITKVDLANQAGLGTGVATFLTTPTSANLAIALTDETGTGAVVFATSPTLVTPALGTPSAIVLTNATGFPTLNQNTTGSAAALSASIAESQVTNLVSDLAAKAATSALLAFRWTNLFAGG
jgi:hypothetical protein